VARFSKSEGIDDSKELELVETYIGSANFPHAVLSHEGGDMKIVHSIAGDARELESEFANYLGVPFCFREDSERWGFAEAFDKAPGLGECQGAGEWCPVSYHPHKLVSDRPGDVPWLGGRPLDREKPLSPIMFFEFPDSRVDQQIGVDDKHPQPFFLARPYRRSSRSRSRRSRSASRLATSVLGVPTLKVGKRKGRLGFRVSRRPWTRNSATSADMVSLRPAARSFKARKTASGMIKVVFIWKTI